MIDSSSTYVALIAGLLSFFSPCIFPLFPIYLTTLGLDGKIITKTNKNIIISTLIFISSFTFIFLVFLTFFVGFLISKRLSYSSERILLCGFFSCFTWFSGFLYFLYKIFNQGDWMKLMIFLNLIIIVNLFTMYFGSWISRKIT